MGRRVYLDGYLWYSKGMDNHEFDRRAQVLEWILFDVDGVLTDGTLLYSHEGETLKTFNVRDGLGFRLAQRAGLKIGLLSGRTSEPLEKRAAELDFDAVMLGSKDKIADLETFRIHHAVALDHIAYVGDDLPDIPVLKCVGLSFAPADAAPEVRAVADVVLGTGGGRGAARELIERVLKARGEWNGLVEQYH